jgi:hypothetical protein
MHIKLPTQKLPQSNLEVHLEYQIVDVSTWMPQSMHGKSVIDVVTRQVVISKLGNETTYLKPQPPIWNKNSTNT